MAQIFYSPHPRHFSYHYDYDYDMPTIVIFFFLCVKSIHFISLLYISLRREMIIEARCREHVAQLAAVLPCWEKQMNCCFLFTFLLIAWIDKSK